jgi:hypothetical protein
LRHFSDSVVRCWFDAEVEAASTDEVGSFVVADGSERMAIPWNTHTVGGARDEDGEGKGGHGGMILEGWDRQLLEEGPDEKKDNDTKRAVAEVAFHIRDDDPAFDGVAGVFEEMGEFHVA